MRCTYVPYEVRTRALYTRDEEGDENPFRTAAPFRGQTAQSLEVVSP